MAEWKKVVVSGSDISQLNNDVNYLIQGQDGAYLTGSFSGSFIGDLTGTASYATSTISASYATSASYANSTTSASYANTSTTASYANSATSASYATSASFASSSTSASYANTATSASYSETATSASYADTTTSASYSETATSASYAETSTSASYADTATSASYSETATSASYADTTTSSSYATSASYADTSISASYSDTATSASYADTTTSASYATSASYSETATSASYAESSSYALSSSYADVATSASYAPSVSPFPFTGSAIISGSLEVIGLTTLYNEGTIVLEVSGSNGSLLTITDDASGDMFTVSSGSIDLFNISSSGETTLSGSLIVTGGTTGSFTGSFVGDGSGLYNLPTQSFESTRIATGSITGSVDVGVNAFTLVSGFMALMNVRANGGFENGANITASGAWSHAEGISTMADGPFSHAEGIGTIASGSGQLAAGRYNTHNNVNSLVVIGNGVDDANRSDLALFNSQSITFNQPVTGSIFTGSFVGDGSGLTGISASYLASSASNGTGISTFTFDGSSNVTVEVSGASALSSDTLTKWTGDAFANTTITDNGSLVTFTADAIFEENITVLGTASFQNTENLLVADRFVLFASGSNTTGDGGIVVQQGTPNTGELYGYDSGVQRWGFTGSFNATSTSYAPEAYIAAVVDVDGGQSDIAKYQKNGNIRVSGSDIYIYA